jgi:hypothetical protein
LTEGNNAVRPFWIEFLLRRTQNRETRSIQKTMVESVCWISFDSGQACAATPGTAAQAPDPGVEHEADALWRNAFLGSQLE